MPKNSEAISVIFILSRVKNNEKNKKYVGLGTSFEKFFFLFNHAVL